MVLIVAVVVVGGVGVCGGGVRSLCAVKVGGESVWCWSGCPRWYWQECVCCCFVVDRFVVCRCSAHAPKLGLRVVVTVRMTVNIRSRFVQRMKTPSRYSEPKMKVFLCTNHAKSTYSVMEFRKTRSVCFAEMDDHRMMGSEAQNMK